MKKLILVLALTSLMSCKKDDESGCYDCTMEIITSVNVSTPGYPQLTTATYETCSGNESGQTTATATQGSITATSVTTITCNKK